MRTRLLILALVVGLAGAVVSAQQLRVDRAIAAGYQARVVPLGLIVKGGVHPPADHVLYHPATGTIIVGLTHHPQRHGQNGAFPGPGDCWEAFDSGILHADTFEVADLDGDGRRNDVLLIASNGHWREWSITLDLFPGCDTTWAY